MKNIYFFDFDGTITRADSFILFSYHSVRKYKFFKYWIKTLFKLLFNLNNRSDLKQKFFIDNFKNFEEDDFKNICNEFIEKYFENLIKSSFLEFIDDINNQSKIVIVSASVNYYLKPWCDKLNFDLICTELELVENRLTGYFSTPNCNYCEKVRRINSKYDLSDYDEIYVFGNSKGDNAMMSLATKSFYKFFK